MSRYLVLYVSGLILAAACTVAGLHSPVRIRVDDPFVHRLRGVLYSMDRPFTGVLEESYANGQAKFESDYRDGKRHGVTRKWYADGGMRFIRTYRDGRKHGTHRGWWENGNLKFVYRFEEGKSQGAQREWYPTDNPLR